MHRMPISYVILSLLESGELTKLQNKWWNEQAKCTMNEKRQSFYMNSDGLALNNLAGVFFVLIVGLILSLFVAIIEFCFRQSDPMKRHQKLKVTAGNTTINAVHAKPKLTIQEQRDFDNGRLTVSKSCPISSHRILKCQINYELSILINHNNIDSMDTPCIIINLSVLPPCFFFLSIINQPIEPLISSRLLCKSTAMQRYHHRLPYRAIIRIRD